MTRIVCVWCWLALAGCLAGGLAGCEDAPTDSDAAAAAAAKARSLPPPLPPPLEPAAAAAATADNAVSSAAAPAAPETVRVPAAVGVGVKGRLLDDPKLVQMIVTPARALFRTRERVVFEIQIPHALQLYEATNGRKPKSHEEFMQEIIQFNQIPLPELPPGQRYVYDPEQGELMVEKPGG